MLSQKYLTFCFVETNLVTLKQQPAPVIKIHEAI